jgi:hypothetical protein
MKELRTEIEFEGSPERSGRFRDGRAKGFRAMNKALAPRTAELRGQAN